MTVKPSCLGFSAVSCLCHCVSPSPVPIFPCFFLVSADLPDMRFQNMTWRWIPIFLFILVQNSESKQIFSQLNHFSCYVFVLNGIELKGIPLNLPRSLKEKQHIRAGKDMGSEAGLFGFKVLNQHQLPVWSQASYLTSLSLSAFTSEDGAMECLLNAIILRILSVTVYKVSRTIIEKNSKCSKNTGPFYHLFH